MYEFMLNLFDHSTLQSCVLLKFDNKFSVPFIMLEKLDLDRISLGRGGSSDEM